MIRGNYHPRYESSVHRTPAGRAVLVLDPVADEGAPSLISAACAIVPELVITLGGPISCAILYRDTVERFDFMVHDGRMYVDFYPGGKTLEDALEVADQAAHHVVRFPG